MGIRGAGAGWIRWRAIGGRAAGVRLSLALGVGVLALACGGGDPAEDIRFAEPTLYTVQQGDDVARIARIHRVDVIEILDWNNLATDAPEVGTTLLIWPHSSTPTVAAGGAAAPAASGGVARSAPRPGRPRPAPAGSAAPAGPDPVAVVDEDPPPRPGVRRAGVLGADDGASEVDLEAASSGLERHETSAGANQRGDGSALASGGQAESLRVEPRRTEAPTGPQIPNKPVTPPRVAKPTPKKCLANTASTVDENGMVREAGLSTGQITAGMAAISRYTPQCFPSGTLGSYAMVVEVTVGCDGRVKNVYTVSPGAIPAPVASCIEQTLASAGFAAHGVPDGMSFQYPMKFKF